MMRTAIRRVITGTASVVALSIAGEIASGALDYAADANTAAAANVPAPAQNSNNVLSSDALRTDDIRWAQLELRNRGLYRGSLDGILGFGTRRAISQFQKINGLDRTALLDAQTWEVLTGNPGIARGASSVPYDADRSGPMTNAFAASDLGK